MGKIHETIDSKLASFIKRQKLYFVATAPGGRDGHVNCSPKGMDSFRVLGPTTVAYLDLTGSGVETIAHVRDNGRICIMFVAFDGPPNIVRLHGRAEAITPDDPAFESLATGFPERIGTRAIIRVNVDRIADSCGYGVPLYDYVGERPSYANWEAAKSRDDVLEYQANRNAESIDGLKGVG